VEFGDEMDEANLTALMDRLLPASAKKVIPSEKRHASVEKVHAKVRTVSMFSTRCTETTKVS
jgi:hypothetical protein